MASASTLAFSIFLAATPGTALSQSAPHGADTSRASSSSLRPGDFVIIKIWREPDLSDTVQIDKDGVAVFPKLGPMQVTGIRPDSLERLLVQTYSRYLKNPSIKVAVLRRITISGAVVRPGAYPVDLTMTVSDALTLAGGPSSEGKSDKVELRRGGRRWNVDLSSQIDRSGELSLQSGDQLFVPKKSWLSRNPGLLVAAIGTATSVAWLITSRN